MTAMVISRLLDLKFWPEFWFEYATGFLFDWLIFQYMSMKKMADTKGKALWMAGQSFFP
jgi:hypothetical protein